MKRILSLIGVVLVVGCGLIDGPYETYHDNGELVSRGTFKDWEPCGEWIEGDETVTHELPC